MKPLSELSDYWQHVRKEMAADVTHSEVHRGLGHPGCVECDGMGYVGDGNGRLLHCWACNSDIPDGFELWGHHAGIWNVPGREGAEQEIVKFTDHIFPVLPADSNRSNLTMVGVTGTGKTRIAKAFYYQAKLHGWEAKYTLGPAITDQIKETYSMPGSHPVLAVYKQYLTPDLLVIDEVDVKESEHSADLLYYLIDRRYSAGYKVTIFCLNTPLDRLKPYWARIRSRMGHGWVVDMGIGDTRAMQSPQHRSS